MKAVVVYESMYGNTREIAEAIGDELGNDAVVHSVVDADTIPYVDLLVVGGPTHMHGLTTSMSRRMAATAAEEEEDVSLEPGASDGPGVRGWFNNLERAGTARAAAFDTRGDANAALTGSAARGIARRLRRRGYDVIGAESFLVADSEGPLVEGELDRARGWARELVEKMQ